VDDIRLGFRDTVWTDWFVESDQPYFTIFAVQLLILVRLKDYLCSHTDFEKEKRERGVGVNVKKFKVRAVAITKNSSWKVDIRQDHTTWFSHPLRNRPHGGAEGSRQDVGLYIAPLTLPFSAESLSYQRFLGFPHAQAIFAVCLDLARDILNFRIKK
jgi:hypothetical protein